MPGRKSTGHRLTRHELKEDHFVTEVMRAVRFVDRRRREVTIVAGALVVVVVGFLVVRSQARAREDEAAKILATAEIALAQGRREEALAGYRHVMASFDGTQAGREAGVYLGQALLEAGDVEGAAEAFQTCLSKPPSRLLRVAAEAGLAACQEERGNEAEAATTYEELAALYHDTYLGPEMLLRAGRCRQRLEQWEAAATLFEDLVDKYPDSSLVPSARFELAYSRTRAEAAGT
jgi:TolA-binding protein